MKRGQRDGDGRTGEDESAILKMLHQTRDKDSDCQIERNEANYLKGRAACRMDPRVRRGRIPLRTFLARELRRRRLCASRPGKGDVGSLALPTRGSPMMLFPVPPFQHSLLAPATSLCPPLCWLLPSSLKRWSTSLERPGCRLCFRIAASPTRSLGLYTKPHAPLPRVSEQRADVQMGALRPASRC